MMKKLWEYSGWIVGAYTIYSHLQTLKKVKDEVYSSLSPEQQKRLDTIMGQVKKEVAQIPGANMVMAEPTIVQLTSGT